MNSASDGKAISGAPRPLILVHDSRFEADALRVAARFLLEASHIDRLESHQLLATQQAIVYIDLGNLETVQAFRARMGGPPPKPRHWAFFVAAGAERHASKVQADALGATEHLDLGRVSTELARLLSVAGKNPVSVERIGELRKARGGETILRAGNELAKLFGNLTSGQKLAAGDIAALGVDIARNVGSVGAENWLATVRSYHEGTFQHCLLVAGVVASFANAHIESPAEAARLSTAALLHDIGKAFVPLNVLDKPGKLTEAEFAAIKAHPGAGFSHLVKQPGMDPVVLDAVRHHHEALDGSGYPDQLKASEILPLTRILTVCDIFAALIEARSYKPPASPDEAITILVRMAVEDKVDYRPVRKLASVVGMEVPPTLAEVKNNLARVPRLAAS